MTLVLVFALLCAIATPLLWFFVVCSLATLLLTSWSIVRDGSDGLLGKWE